jgi:hypothetical protein
MARFKVDDIIKNKSGTVVVIDLIKDGRYHVTITGHALKCCLGMNFSDDIDIFDNRYNRVAKSWTLWKGESNG